MEIHNAPALSEPRLIDHATLSSNLCNFKTDLGSEMRGKSCVLYFCGNSEELLSLIPPPAPGFRRYRRYDLTTELAQHDLQSHLYLPAHFSKGYLAFSQVQLQDPTRPSFSSYTSQLDHR